MALAFREVKKGESIVLPPGFPVPARFRDGGFVFDVAQRAESGNSELHLFPARTPSPSEAHLVFGTYGFQYTKTVQDSVLLGRQHVDPQTAVLSSNPVNSVSSPGADSVFLRLSFPHKMVPDSTTIYRLPILSNVKLGFSLVRHFISGREVIDFSCAGSVLSVSGRKGSDLVYARGEMTVAYKTERPAPTIEPVNAINGVVGFFQEGDCVKCDGTGVVYHIMFPPSLDQK
ncbi:hypothetical protein HZC07_05465 [Candidatus Micrarchaeota archaeon]|nr:hypothetical protein [Candidatus Micrarchaeota archaeon]